MSNNYKSCIELIDLSKDFVYEIKGKHKHLKLETHIEYNFDAITINGFSGLSFCSRINNLLEEAINEIQSGIKHDKIIIDKILKEIIQNQENIESLEKKVFYDPKLAYVKKKVTFAIPTEVITTPKLAAEHLGVYRTETEVYTYSDYIIFPWYGKAIKEAYQILLDALGSIILMKQNAKLIPAIRLRQKLGKYNLDLLWLLLKDNVTASNIGRVDFRNILLQKSNKQITWLLKAKNQSPSKISLIYFLTKLIGDDNPADIEYMIQNCFKDHSGSHFKNIAEGLSQFKKNGFNNSTQISDIDSAIHNSLIKRS